MGCEIFILLLSSGSVQVTSEGRPNGFLYLLFTCSLSYIFCLIFVVLVIVLTNFIFLVHRAIMNFTRDSEISRLTERWPLYRTRTIEGDVRTPSSIQVVMVYRSDNDTTANRIFFSCLRKMNAVNYSEGDLQLCGYYASCILTVFPMLGLDFTNAISELGGKVSMVNENQFGVMGFELTDPCPAPALLVAVCQLFL